MNIFYPLILSLYLAGFYSCTTPTSHQIEQEKVDLSNSASNGSTELGPYEKLEKEKTPTVVSEDDLSETTVKEMPTTVIGYDEYSDPLEPINRPIFYFNDYLYRYLFGPLASGYDYITPEIVDMGVSNFFYNLREPLYFLNNLFQGELKKSGTNLIRFVCNSTLGVLGLYDAAKDLFSLERKRATLGGTLSFYGLGYGAYLVLPFLGPTDFRDSTDYIFDYFLHPLKFTKEKDTAAYFLTFDGFQDRVPTLTSYDEIVKDLEDPYIFVRNLHLQRVMRDAQSRRGEEFLNAKGHQKKAKDEN